MTLAIAFKNTTSDYSGTGAGLGGRLTSSQADNNNWLIKQAIETLQAATGKTISSCSATGNQLTITYTNATTDVITLPTAMPVWRGEWEPSTSYAQFDWFWEATTNAIYSVLIAHESATSFDAGEVSGSDPIYQKILEVVGDLPTGGTIGQVAVKLSSDDYDYAWGFSVSLIKEVSDLTYIPLISDANSYIRCTHSGGCTISPPNDSITNFPIGTEFHFRQCAPVGVISFDDANAAVNTPADCNPNTQYEGSVVTLKKVAANSWDLFGKLEPASV